MSEHGTPDQKRAEEKRRAGQERAAAAAKASAKQEWPAGDAVVDEGDEHGSREARTAPPKGRKSASAKSEG